AGAVVGHGDILRSSLRLSSVGLSKGGASVRGHAAAAHLTGGAPVPQPFVQPQRRLLRRVVVAVLALLLPLAGVLAPGQAQATRAQTAPTHASRALPQTVVVRDGRTSDPVVDIATVRLDASWYWDSEQGVRV